VRALGLAAAAVVTLGLLGLAGGDPWWAPPRAPPQTTWPPPAGQLVVPDGGFDLRYTQQQLELAKYLARRVVRVDAVHVPPPPYDPDNLRVEDGAGTVVAPGVLLTTARYLEGAARLEVVLRDGTHLSATVRLADPHVDLALVAFDAARAPRLRVVDGVAPVPPRAGKAKASVVVMPTTLEGQGASVRIAAALVDGPTLYLSGQALNGVPAFDTSGRLVAVTLRMTPDRSRSIGLGGRVVSAWLKAHLGAAPAKKTGPRAGRGGRGP
jgi:S1-C subfamily serine protease